MEITQHFSGGPIDGATHVIEDSVFADRLDGEGNRTGLTLRDSALYMLSIADSGPTHTASYTWFEQALDG